MLGILGTILGWILYIFWIILFYVLKFLFYLFAILLFLLWKHQGALLYMRHAPQRKRQIAYNDHPRVRSPAHYNIPYEDFFVETVDKVSVHCWLLRQGTNNSNSSKNTNSSSKTSKSGDKSSSTKNDDSGNNGSNGNLTNDGNNGNNNDNNNENTNESNNNNNKRYESCNYSTIVLFHGNAGNIGYRLPNAYAMYKYLRCNVLLIDYRGYGNSEGVPTEHGIIYDCEALLNHICNNDDINKYIDTKKIFIFGRSLGGAVAIDLAYRYCTNKMLQCRPIIANGPNDINLSKINRNGSNSPNSLNSSSISSKNKSKITNMSSNANTNNNNKNNSNLSETEALIGNNNNNNENDLKELEKLNKKYKEWEKKPCVEIAGVIVENTFTSILDMVFVLLEQAVQGLSGKNNENGDNDNNHSRHSSNSNKESLSDYSEKNTILRYVRLFLKYFITNRWESVDKVNDIGLPILYLSGLKDELIPPAHMRKLNENTNRSSMKLFRSYPNGDHNSTWQRGGAQYYEDIQEFVALVVSNIQERN